MEKRIAESLKILNNLADQLLADLYNTNHQISFDMHPLLDSVCSDSTAKTVNSKEGPRILNEQNYASVQKALLKKFPDVPDMQKVQGYQSLVSESRSMTEELRHHYTILVDSVEFLETAQSVLFACEKLVGLNSVQHFALTNGFFQLLTNYVYISLMMIESSTEKKVIAACFNLLHMNERSSPEQSFARVSKFLVDSEKFYTNMPEALGPMSNFVSQLLQTYYAEYIRGGAIPIEILRKDVAYSVTSNVKADVYDDLKLRLLPSFNQFTTFIVISAFCFPSEFLKQAPLADMLKFMISQVLTCVLFRSELFNIQSEFENLAKANSKLSKLKSLINDNLGSGITKAVAMHQERRSYLRFNLKQILHLGGDRPFILAHKLPIIESLLSLAREEILFYFSHHDKTIASKIPKLAPKPPATQQPTDTSIVELIQLVVDIRQLLLKEVGNIQSHFAELMKSHYSGNLEAAIGELFRTNAPFDAVTKSLREILDMVKDARPELSFEPLRLNYSRLLAHIHSSQTSIAVSTIPEFVNIMNEIYTRSRYVDELVGAIETATDLKFLYYYRPHLEELYQECMSGHQRQIRYSHVFLKLAGDFIKNANPFEFKRVGIRSQMLAEDFLNFSAKVTVDLIWAVGQYAIYFDSQVLPESSVKFAPDRREKPKQKNVEKPAEPGSESKDGSNLNALTELKQSMINMIRMFGQSEHYRIYDSEFRPKEYLLEVIISKFQAYLSSNAIPEEAPAPAKDPNDEPPFPIKRPLIFFSEITSFLSLLQYIDEICDMGVTNSALDVLLNETEIDRARRQGAEIDTQNMNKKGPKVKKVNFVPGQSFVVTYTQWYCELLKDRGTTGNLILSPLKKCLVSSPNAVFQTIVYSHPGELIALCEIFGPSGVRYFDERLIQIASGYVKDIKDIITANQDALQAFEKSWFQDNKLEEFAKKLKQMDELLQKSINLGFIMEFRVLLFDAFAQVMENVSPGVFKMIKRAHWRYPPNIYSMPNFMLLDNLANYVGVRDRIDTSFRSAMQIHCRNPAADQRIFSLFPYVYAYLMKQIAMDEKCVYHAKLDAYENNAHCLPLAISTMFTNLISITVPNDVDTLARIQREFILVSSNLLLRLRGDADALKASYTLLLKFVQNSKHLTEDVLEEYLPYTLVRDGYSDLFVKAGFNKLTSRVGADEDTQTEQ